MKNRARRMRALFGIGLVLTLSTYGLANPAHPVIPNPVITFLGAEYLTVSGSQQTRYYFEVFNREDYPPDMFAASPKLPPCGSNTNASRTWNPKKVGLSFRRHLWLPNLRHHSLICVS